MAYQAGSDRLLRRVGAWLTRPVAYQLRSVVAKGVGGLRWVTDACFVKWHRLDCGGFIRNTELETLYSGSLPHAKAYQAIPCVLVAKLLDEAERTGTAFDNFIDIGSGKGKACFYAATKRRFKKIIGVEFSGPLVAVADLNKKRFSAHDISFVTIDATLFSLPPGDNLVFLFNPFGEPILRQFLENNIAHFRESRSLIAYANDQHRSCLAGFGFSTLFRNQELKCSLYRYG